MWDSRGGCLISGKVSPLRTQRGAHPHLNTQEDFVPTSRPTSQTRQTVSSRSPSTSSTSSPSPPTSFPRTDTSSARPRFVHDGPREDSRRGPPSGGRAAPSDQNEVEWTLSRGKGRPKRPREVETLNPEGQFVFFYGQTLSGSG